MDLGRVCQKADRMGMICRPLQRRDRGAVEEMLQACGAFSEEEVRVALRLVDEGLEEGSEGYYALFAVEIDGAVHGYACLGETLLTRSTWHLYWICVHPDAQGTGAGRALQLHAEAFVRDRGGERIVLETDGRESYARTRRFYQRAGYEEVGWIRDYYKPGSDLVLFCKELSGQVD